MIAGRTRFYVVAGIVGAIVGEAGAGAILIGIAQLAAVERPSIVLIFVAGGMAGGAWCGVTLMRRWYQTHADRKGPTEPAR